MDQEPELFKSKLIRIDSDDSMIQYFFHLYIYKPFHSLSSSHTVEFLRDHSLITTFRQPMTEFSFPVVGRSVLVYSFSYPKRLTSRTKGEWFHFVPRSCVDYLMSDIVIVIYSLQLEVSYTVGSFCKIVQIH